MSFRGIVASSIGCAALGLVSAGPATAADSLPVDRTLTDPRIIESSGLAASNRFPGVLWTHNDSGDTARIFAIGAGGRTRATYRFAGVQARDWEDMASSTASGRPELWVGDTGDNGSSRTQGILIHRIAEPTRLRDGIVRPTSYRLRYPDGPHDAEAMLVHPRTGRVYIVTKGVLGGDVYRAPDQLRTGTPNVLERLGSAPALVTDGVFLPDGRAALRDYSAVTIVASLDDPRADQTRIRVIMPRVGDRPAQAESIALGRAGEVLLGSEGSRSPVVRLRLPGAPAATSEPASPPPTTRTSPARPGSPTPTVETTGPAPEESAEAASPDTPARPGSGGGPALLGAVAVLAVGAALVMVGARRGGSSRP